YNTFIRNIVLHIGSRKLVDTRTHRNAAVINVHNASVFHIQAQRHVYALHVLAQSLSDRIGEGQLRKIAVHLDDHAATVCSLQLKLKFDLCEDISVLQNLEVFEFCLELLCVQAADISSQTAALRVDSLADLSSLIDRSEELLQSV